SIEPNRAASRSPPIGMVVVASRGRQRRRERSRAWNVSEVCAYGKAKSRNGDPRANVSEERPTREGAERGSMGGGLRFWETGDSKSPETGELGTRFNSTEMSYATS